MLNITAARRARQQRTVELNIAPLIDMVFILLIFFLVTTSFVKETGIPVERPVAGTAEKQEATGIRIKVSRDNLVYMDGKEMDPRMVRMAVEEVLAKNPGAPVLIEADRKSETGVLVTVMDGCRAAGAEDVGLTAVLPGRGAP